ncbi:SMP-30/gluconolactonase/LRE family protein [Sphingomonas ginkgonis]|uniref:SMP-30/gluconolactonase/LRE family protein n=1 Tax=Sphingomonas ginkgonis TaxID=2315330 RepID=A0A429VCM8_9SPHN|nr:SMP-30/gluconolactonase/LRE family protein [Sphingomonas ginkgonis]RST31646.1 SMP-30/gluconolactonase/LRE family protein [Sphingomonas ginkgonis]
MDQPICVWPVAATLGEGPVWVERDQALWFVDIKQQKIHRYDPADGGRRSWDSPEQVGFVLPADDGAFVAGLQSGLHRFDPAEGSFERLCRVDEDLRGHRLNDGVVDPSGRLWFGTMDDDESGPTGRYYSYFRGELVRQPIGGFTVTNGPAFSPDGRLIYFTDTHADRIWRAPVDRDGKLGEPEPFVEIGAGNGHPDGPSVDSQGFVWTAQFGGARALRYSPDGELVGMVAFSVPNVTKVAFGGADRSTGYATTARLFMSDEQVADRPQAGALFAFALEVPGLPCPLVSL